MLKMRSLYLATMATLLLPACLIESGELIVEEPEDEIVIDTTGDSWQYDEPTPYSPPTTNDPSSTEPEPTQSSPGTGTGQETLQCPMGQMLCADMCLDTSADDANCGGCGNVCDGGRVCMASDCACEVGEFCDGACVDTTSSALHCGGCNSPCAGGMACVDSMCVNVTEVEGVLLATNEARASGANCGVYGSFGPAPALQGDPNLHIAAQAHAEDMAINNFFSHTGSDGSSFSQRVGRTDYQGFPMGENIAAGQQSPSGVVSSWIDSDGHCRNLMNPDATRIGIGFAVGGPYGTLWVQVFGR